MREEVFGPTLPVMRAPDVPCLVNYAAPSTPFGGVGASGSARQNGAAGLRAYCFTQTIKAGWLNPPRAARWFPRIAGRRSWTRLARLLYRH